MWRKKRCFFVGGPSGPSSFLSRNLGIVGPRYAWEVGGSGVCNKKSRLVRRAGGLRLAVFFSLSFFVDPQILFN